MARFKWTQVAIPSAFAENSDAATSWFDWKWQMRRSLQKKSDFAQYFDLTDTEKLVWDSAAPVFNIRSTPYYAALAQQDESGAIRKIQVPSHRELMPGAQQMLDPLGEKRNNPTPRLIHRYSDRALFLITDICSVYCRYCTRKHFTGQEQAFIANEEYELALGYLRAHPGIKEVILSGGDPLTLSDALLDRVLGDLRRIDSVEIIRIGSRLPVVAPMRITIDLVEMIRRHKPVFMMTHFNHPAEITDLAAEALERLVDHGIPVMNQMVLLNGVNNHPALVQALNRRLLFLRVKPYYMFQCDPSEGSDHLRTSIEDSMQIQKELMGHLSGLATAQLSVDIPDGGGKAYLVPDWVVHKSSNEWRFKGWDGVEASYINPASSSIEKPKVAESYIEEWHEIKTSKYNLHSHCDSNLFSELNG